MNPKTHQFVTTNLTLLARRLAEQGLDRAFETGTGRQLQELRPLAKLLVEGALYSGVGLAALKSDPTSTWQQMALEVGKAVAPSIAYRINRAPGTSGAPVSTEEPCLEDPLAHVSPEQRRIIEAMLKFPSPAA